MTKKWWTLLLVAAFLLSLTALVACSDDDDTAPDGDDTTEDGDDTDGDDTDGDDTTPDGDDADGDTGGGTANFRGFVLDFSSRAKLSGVTVHVLDNETGEKLNIPAGTTDADGYVNFTINVPSGSVDEYRVGFLCEGVTGDSVDTYQFNILANDPDERLWLVDNTTYNFAPALAGVTLTAGTTVVAGGVYWVNDDGDEEIVGCSTVSTDTGSGDVRYFGDNDMPTTLANRENINPRNGFFIIANIQPGVVNVQGDVGGNEFGSTRLVAKPNSICISNIYAETDSNPGTCN